MSIIIRMENESLVIQDGDGSLINGSMHSRPEDNCSADIKGEWKRHWELSDEFSWWFEGVGLTTVAGYGVFLNWLAISILKTPKLSCFFNHLLCCLAVFDINFLLSSMLYHLAVFEPNILSYHWTTTFFIYVISPLRSMVMLCSIYMTVALSYDRYKAVSNPAEYKIQERTASSSSCGQLTRPIAYTSVIIFFSILFYLPKFFDLETKQNIRPCKSTNETFVNDTNCNVVEYSIQGTALRNNDKFILWYVNIANFLFTVAIPVFSLTYFNIMIYRKVKVFIRRQPSARDGKLSNAQKERSKEIQQAYQLFGIVFLFIACHALRVILNIDELVNAHKKHGKCDLPRNWSRAIIPPIAHFMLSLNSSTNFFVYCFFNKVFRVILKEKLANLFECCPALTILQRSRANNNVNGIPDRANSDDANNLEMAPVRVVNIIDTEVPDTKRAN